jgi:hypothetical protein
VQSGEAGLVKSFLQTEAGLSRAIHKLQGLWISARPTRSVSNRIHKRGLATSWFVSAEQTKEQKRSNEEVNTLNCL